MVAIALVSQKGGSGRTTIACHLGAIATASGYVTCIVDLDPQATAAAWGDWRARGDPAVITSPPTRLAKTLKDAKELGSQIAIIDTPPFAESAAHEAAKQSDLVLVPCRPRAFDLHSIKLTAELVNFARKPAFVIWNGVPHQASKLLADAVAIIRQFDLKAAPVSLAERAIYHHSTAIGKVAAEVEPEGIGASEIEALWSWLCQQVNMPIG